MIVYNIQLLPIVDAYTNNGLTESDSKMGLV